MAKKVSVKWLSRPEDHDYPAALSYLSLRYDPKAAAGMAGRLKRGAMAEFKAKDIFRASALPLPGTAYFHVKRDRQNIMSGGRDVAAAARPGFGQWPADHRRRLPSDVRGLFVR